MMPVELRQPEVERDRWGRPKINGKTYQRPSTVAKAIEAAGGLPKWMGTRVFEGLREQPELLNAPGDIRELVEAAADAGGANAGSGFGTAVHEVVESLTMTGSVPTVLRSGTAPSEQHVECARSVLDLLDAYGFDVVLSEVFVVAEDHGAAGTTDLVLKNRESGRLYIGDVKTSGSAAATATKFSSLSWSIQLAIYADGKVLTEEGSVAFSDVLGKDVAAERAVVIHVERDTAKATLIDIDLDAGRDAAGLAASVMAMRKTSPGRVIH